MVSHWFSLCCQAPLPDSQRNPPFTLIAPPCSSEEAAIAEARLKEAEARLAADRLALQLEQQRVAVAEEKAAATLLAAKEQAARADEERSWLRAQQQDLTPRLESAGTLQAEAKQRARELAAEAADLARQRAALDGEKAALERLRGQLEASQAAAERALAQAADVSAREQALAAKERAAAEAEAALKLREAQLAQVLCKGACVEVGLCAWTRGLHLACMHMHALPVLQRRSHACRLTLTFTAVLPLQAEAATSSDRQRLSGLSRELENRAAADSDALLRLQETLAAQQEELQR